MIGDNFIQVLGYSPEAWAKRYGIEPFTVNCHECGAAKTTSIPIMTKELRGLSAPPCACGSQSRTYCVVAAPGLDLFDVMKEQR